MFFIFQVSKYTSLCICQGSYTLPDHHFEVPADRHNEIAQVCIFLGMVCSVIMGVSRRGGDLIMGLIAIIVHLVYRNGPSNETRHADTLAQIPSTITAALSKLNLDGQTTIYAVCPTCHCTYKPVFNRNSSIPTYPERCSNKPQPESGECHEPLLESPVDISPISSLQLWRCRRWRPQGRRMAHHVYHPYPIGSCQLVGRRHITLFTRRWRQIAKCAGPHHGPSLRHYSRLQTDNEPGVRYGLPRLRCDLYSRLATYSPRSHPSN